MPVPTARCLGASALFLVDDLPKALAHYEERLGFRTAFVYQGVYGAVERDGVVIHLKPAAKTPGERENRARNHHLDLYVAVDDARALHHELSARGATVTGLEDQPWRQREFTVTDADGYILLFGQDLDRKA